MAIYHFPTRNVSRSSGRSAVAAAAYRAGIVLEDERTGRTHDYSRKVGVVSAEIMAPAHAPAWMQDRERLWNAVEQAESRKDARTAREFIAALPHELDKFERQTLVRRFVAEQFVSQSMVADVSIHHPDRHGDQRNHHAHILLTTRRVEGDGFSATKAREWNSEGQLIAWREAWANHVNLALERGEQARGLEPGTFARVDHRSLEEQGIERDATIHLGPIATALERAGTETRLGDHNREVEARAAELATLRQERARIEAEIIDLEAERSRRRVAELAAEIPYMAPVAAELARVASGQPGDGSALAQRVDRLAEAAERAGPPPPSPELVASWRAMEAARGEDVERLPDPSEFGPLYWRVMEREVARWNEAGRPDLSPQERPPATRTPEAGKSFNAAAERTTPPPPSPELVAAWRAMEAAQGHSVERLPDPSEFGPRFWEAMAQYLAQETARREQAEQAQARTAERREDGALRDLLSATAGEHPAIAQAVERMQGQRRQERREDSQARGLLWLDQTVRGFDRIGTKAADMFGRVAGKLVDMICDLFDPNPQSRMLSPEERAERQALEAELEAAQERRDYRDREQRQRLASVVASLEYDRRQREQEQTLERTRERTRPGPR
jgi:hypothetical protein